jgi:hypothetical protein
MRAHIQPLAAILLVLALPFCASALTADDARQDLSWKADLKGLSDPDKSRILDSFEKLHVFVTVREAHNLCLESIRHARPPAPEQQSSVSIAPADRGGLQDAAEAWERQSAGKSAASDTGRSSNKKNTENSARKNANSSTRPEGKLDHGLLGLERPLFPSILDEAQ